MSNSIYSIITGSGCYIPTRIVKNEDFLNNVFYDESGEKFDKTNEDIIEKFRLITDIEERKHVTDDLVASDIAFLAAQDALNSSGIDKESIDYIIVAHNFGDVMIDNRRSDFVPNLAARVKHKLGIENFNTIPYDLPFGCPGWLEGVILANNYIKVGSAKRVLVIGAETLSRISDPHDRDSMLYSDGAGAVIVEATNSDSPTGILSHKTRSDTLNHAFMLRMAKSYNKDYGSDELFLKMNGRKLYEYALKTVPQVIKDCIETSGLLLENIAKVLLHQANAKMDEAMLNRLFALYGIKDIPSGIMPMMITKFGNNSVATLPILFDQIIKGKIKGQQFSTGDDIVFASIGAGMNVNSLVYRIN